MIDSLILVVFAALFIGLPQLAAEKRAHFVTYPGHLPTFELYHGTIDL